MSGKEEKKTFFENIPSNSSKVFSGRERAKFFLSRSHKTPEQLALVANLYPIQDNNASGEHDNSQTLNETNKKIPKYATNNDDCSESENEDSKPPAKKRRKSKRLLVSATHVPDLSETTNPKKISPKKKRKKRKYN